MLAQIGYVGCFWRPEPEQMVEMEHLMITFVKGKLNIAKDRLFAEPSERGVRPN
jgi:hypothetical protein